MAERRLVDLDQAQTYTAPNGAQYRLRPNSSGLLLPGGTTENPATAEAPATDAVAMWKASEYDGSSQFLRDSSGNGHHLRFGSQFPAYIAKGALNLPGVAGNYASTPDSAAISITGDIDIRVHAALTDWTPSTDRTLIGKRQTSTTYSFRLYVNTSGRLILVLSPDGTEASMVAATSSLSPTIADGEASWVRATWQQSDGRVQFFTSADGATWNQLGSDQSIAIVSIADTTSMLELGSSGVGNQGPFSGQIFYAEVRNGIDGPVAAKFDPSEVEDFTTSFQSITGETWTVESPGGRIMDKGQGLRSIGAANPTTSAFVQVTPELKITGDIEAIWYGALGDWTPSSNTDFFSRWGVAGVGAYGMRVGTDGKIWFSWMESDTTPRGAASSVAPTVTDGEYLWLKVTLDVDNGSGGNTATFYTSTDGEAWSQLGTAQTQAFVTNIGVGTANFQVFGGTLSGSGPTGQINYCRRVIIKNGIDGDAALDADFSTLEPYTESFVCSTGQRFYLSNQTGSDSGDPKYLPVEDNNYLYLPGTSNNRAQMIHHPGVSVTGDLDVRVDVALDDYTAATQQALIGKWDNSASRAWYFRVNTNGTLRLTWSTDGTHTTGLRERDSTVALSTVVEDGKRVKLRVTLDVDNGSGGHDVKFYYRFADNTAWTQLGSTVTTAGTTSIFAGTDNLTIGEVAGVQQVAGKFYRATVKDGINGTTVYDVDFTEAEPDSTTIDNGIFPILANRTTFTRATTAYLDGVEVASGTPRYTLSPNLVNNADQINLWDKGSGVSIEAGRPDPDGGNNAFRVTTNNASHDYIASGASPWGDSLPNATHSFGAWLRGSGSITMYSGGDTGQGIDALTPINLTSSWVFYSRLNRSVGNNSVAIGMMIRNLAPSEWFEIYHPQNEYSATLGPWRPDGYSNILIEEGTTNLLSTSQSQPSGWTAPSTGASMAANAGTDPLGTTTATQFSEGTGNTNHRMIVFLGDRSSAPISHSIYAKANGRSYLHLFHGIGETGAVFNLQAGTIESTDAGVSSSITPAGNGWFRCTISKPLGSTGEHIIVAPLESATVTVSYQGDGRAALWLWHAQSEAKAYATSWQLGGTARNHENVRSASILPVAATYEFDTTIPFNIPSGSTATLMRTGTWANENLFTIYWTQIGNGLQVTTYRSGAFVNASWSAAQHGMVQGGSYRLAITIEGGGVIGLYVNGSLISKQTVAAANVAIPGSIPTGVTYIGSADGNQQFWNAGIDAVRLQSTVNPATDMSPLTATPSTIWLQEFRSTFEGQYSAVTTINRSTSGRKSVVVDRDLFLFGADDYMEAPDHDDMDFAAGDSFTAVAVFRRFGTGNHTFIAKSPSVLSSGTGWGLARDTSGPYVFTEDGTVLRWDYGAHTVDGESTVFVGVRNKTTGMLVATTNGVSASSSADTDTSTNLNSDLTLRIGRLSGSGSLYADMEFIGAAIWRRALTDEEISFLAGEFGVDS